MRVFEYFVYILRNTICSNEMRKIKCKKAYQFY